MTDRKLFTQISFSTPTSHITFDVVPVNAWRFRLRSAGQAQQFIRVNTNQKVELVSAEQKGTQFFCVPETNHVSICCSILSRNYWLKLLEDQGEVGVSPFPCELSYRADGLLPVAKSIMRLISRSLKVQQKALKGSSNTSLDVISITSNSCDDIISIVDDEADVMSVTSSTSTAPELVG